MASKLAVFIWNLGGENQSPVFLFHKSLWVTFTLCLVQKTPNCKIKDISNKVLLLEANANPPPPQPGLKGPHKYKPTNEVFTSQNPEFIRYTQLLIKALK